MTITDTTTDDELAMIAGPNPMADVLTDETWTPAPEADKPEKGDSWRPVDLSDIVARIRNGTITTPKPRYGLRTDGPPVMLYPGKYHALNGASEGGKTWLALKVCDEAARTGARVAWVDAEDNGETFCLRWQALGGDLDMLTDGTVSYIRPMEGTNAERWKDIVRAADVVFLDTINALMTAEGLDPIKIEHFAQWFRIVGRTALDAGAAVLALDHVPHRSNSRQDRSGFGTVAKLNVIDGAAFMLEAVVTPAQGVKGHSTLRITKDRPGAIRRHAIGGRLAEIRFTPGESVYGLDFGAVDVSIEPPENNTAENGKFRPTNYMAKASETLAENGAPMSKTAWREATGGSASYVGDAIARLIEEGYARYTGEPTRGGGRLIEHVKTYTNET